MVLGAILMKKPGVRSARVREGVYVSHRDRGFLIKEPRLDALIPRLLGLLDGTRSPSEIRAALPDKVTAVFDLLLNGLARNFMLTPAPTKPLPDDVPKSVIHLLQNALSRWEACLDAWRTRSVTVWIEHDLLDLVVRPLVEQGVRAITVVDHDGTAREALARAGVADGATFVTPEHARGHEQDMLLALIGIPTLPHLLKVVDRHHKAVIGVVTAGGSAIAEHDASLADFLEGSGLDPRDGTARPPRHALCVAAAMVAFEALRSIVTEFSDDETEIAERRHAVRIVHRDGTVVSHDRRVALASGRKIAQPAEDPDAATALVEPPNAWHHRDVGPFAEHPVAGPAFPLPHVAKRITVTGADGKITETIVTAWGVDPAEAARRCAAQAFEMLCGGLSQIAVADADADAAAAFARVLHAVGGYDGSDAPVDLAAGWSDDVAMLARLARLYWGQTPEVALGCTGDASIATASLGAVRAVGIAPEPDAAIREALGELVSALQLGQPTTRQSRRPWRDVPSQDKPGTGSDALAPVECTTFRSGAAAVVVAVVKPR